MAKITIKDSEISSSANIHFSGSISGPSASFGTLTNVTTINATTISGATGQFGQLTASNGYISDRLGVGTSSPATTLHVNGSSLLSGSVTSYYTSMTAGTPYAAVPGGASDGAAVFNVGFSNYNGWIKFNSPNVVNNNSKSWIGAVYNSAYSQNLLFYSGKQGNNSFTNQESALNAVFAQNLIAFYTTTSGTGNTVERMRIRDDGNVGIGTSSPTSKLEVYNGRIRANTNTNTAWFEVYKPDAWASSGFIITDGTNNTIYLRDAGSAAGLVGLYSGNGRNLAIGTELNLGKTLTLQGSTIYLKDADTPYPNTVTVINNKVGIGTESPDYTLSVTGTLGVSGNTTLTTVSGTTAQFTSITGSFSGNGSNITSLNYSNISNPPTIGNATITISAGNGLTTGGSFTTNQTGAGTITLNVGAGTGITVAADTVSIDTSVVPRLGVNNTFTGTNTFGVLTASNIQVDTITAREFYTQLVTASVLYESGSTKFGDTLDDLHQFTGSVDVTGSVRTSNLVISQDAGSTVQPQIQFIGSSSNPITLKVLDDNSLSFVNNSGFEVFHIDADLTGTIFSVTDGSGIPSIEVEDTGDITLAEFGGNVGVGTGSPAYKLDVSGTMRVTGASQFASVSGTLAQFNSLTVLNGSTSLASVSGTIGEFTEITASNLRINSNSSLIGDAEITGLIKHGINSIDLFGSGDDMVFKAGYTQSDFNFTNTSNTSLMYISQSGNIGIGTTSPTAAKLQVEGSFVAKSGFSTYTGEGLYDANAVPSYISLPNGDKLIFGYRSVGNGKYYGRVSSFVDTDDKVSWGAAASPNTFSVETSGSERFRINDSGNIGIGTTNPTAKLYVSGSQIIRATVDNQDPLLELREYRDGALARFYESGDAGFLKLGYYGITTSNLTLNGGSSNLGGSIAGQHNATTGFVITSNTSSDSYILSDVGIGLTTPSAKLDVSGSTIFGKLLTHTHQFTGSIDITGSARTSNLIISPDAGSTVQPKITYIGSSSNPIELKVLDDNTLSWEGSAGQLFSIANNLTGGVIFSVGDVSGIPLLEAEASGTVSMARFGTQVGIGTNQTTDTLTVSGGVDITGSLSIDGFHTSWGTTSGILTQGLNIRMGTGTDATWLITGTSNGTFRGGIQQLDGGNGARWYTNSISQYASLASSGLSLAVGSFTSPGNFFASNGSQTAPSFTFSGDTNTGMFLGTTDELAFTTAGSERLRIDNTGLVGIGTTNPIRLTHIEKALDLNESLLYIKNTTTGRPAYIGLKSPTKSFTFGIHDSIGLVFAPTDGIIASTNDILMTLQTGGNLGIGTTTPSAKLDVNGTTNLRNNLTVTGSLFLSGSAHYVTGNVDISGTLSAVAKSFDIEHPTKEGMRLVYGSLESPYHGVRLTGESCLIKGESKVFLPDYISSLCKQEDSSVQITNIKHGKVLWVEEINIEKNYFIIKTDIEEHDNKLYNFFWSFTAIRKDIEDLVVEKKV